MLKLKKQQNTKIRPQITSQNLSWPQKEKCCFFTLCPRFHFPFFTLCPRFHFSSSCLRLQSTSLHNAEAKTTRFSHKTIIKEQLNPSIVNQKCHHMILHDIYYDIDSCSLTCTLEWYAHKTYFKTYFYSYCGDKTIIVVISKVSIMVEKIFVKRRTFSFRGWPTRASIILYLPCLRLHFISFAKCFPNIKDEDSRVFLHAGMVVWPI